MNVVDSSGWLEYFANGKKAAFFAPAIEDPSKLIVPTLSLFEVFKRVLQQRGEAPALQAWRSCTREGSSTWTQPSRSQQRA